MGEIMKKIILITLVLSAGLSANEITFKNCSDKAINIRCEGPWLRRSTKDLDPSQSYAYNSTAGTNSAWQCTTSASLGAAGIAVTNIALVPLTNVAARSGKDFVSFSMADTGNTVIFNGDNAKGLPRLQAVKGAGQSCQ